MDVHLVFGLSNRPFDGLMTRGVFVSLREGENLWVCPTKGTRDENRHKDGIQSGVCKKKIIQTKNYVSSENVSELDQ